MNCKQRIILIIGAAFFLYAIFTSPKVSIVKGTYITPPSDRKDIARIADVSTAIVRAIAVLGVTLLVCIAFKDKRKRWIPSPTDRNPIGDCQESQHHSARENIIANIIRFLKDFF